MINWGLVTFSVLQTIIVQVYTDQAYLFYYSTMSHHGSNFDLIRWEIIFDLFQVRIRLGLYCILSPFISIFTNVYIIFFLLEDKNWFSLSVSLNKITITLFVGKADIFWSTLNKKTEHLCVWLDEMEIKSSQFLLEAAFWLALSLAIRI